MKFQIIFERAGDGSATDRERVKNGLVQQLRVPPETADQMVSGAPLVVKQDLTQEQADSYRKALESVGVVVSVNPMPEEQPMIFLEPVVGAPPPSTAVAPPPPLQKAPPVQTQPAAPQPIFEDTADWWMSLRIVYPPFDEPKRGASPLTAGKVRASGEAFTLSHPMLDRIYYQDILVISVFRTAQGRHYIDLYCPGQNRPIRLDHDLILFSTFGLPETENPVEAMYYFTRLLIQKCRTSMADLPTFRFLRDLESIKVVENERDVEKYIARLTADLLSPETARPGENIITALDAEKLRDAVDPWIPPPPQPMPPLMPGYPGDNPYGATMPLPPEGYPGYAPGMPPMAPGQPMPPGMVAPPGAAPPVRTGPLPPQPSPNYSAPPAPPVRTAPPPGMAPPPGIAPAPPVRMAPPPGLTPPPGVAPSSVMPPPPGVPPPPGIAPPGMIPPVRATGPQPVFVPPAPVPPPLPPPGAAPLEPNFVPPGTGPLIPQQTISLGGNDTLPLSPGLPLEPKIEISLPGFETTTAGGEGGGFVFPDQTQSLDTWEQAETVPPGASLPPVFVPPAPVSAAPENQAAPPLLFVPPTGVPRPSETQPVTSFEGFAAPVPTPIMDGENSSVTQSVFSVPEATVPVEVPPAQAQPPQPVAESNPSETQAVFSAPGAAPPVRTAPPPVFQPPQPVAESSPSETQAVFSPPSPGLPPPPGLPPTAFPAPPGVPPVRLDPSETQPMPAPPGVPPPVRSTGFPEAPPTSMSAPAFPVAPPPQPRNLFAENPAEPPPPGTFGGMAPTQTPKSKKGGGLPVTGILIGAGILVAFVLLGFLLLKLLR